MKMPGMDGAPSGGSSETHRWLAHHLHHRRHREDTRDFLQRVTNPVLKPFKSPLREAWAGWWPGSRG
jgi:hypothetical protein